MKCFILCTTTLSLWQIVLSKPKADPNSAYDSDSPIYDAVLFNEFFDSDFDCYTGADSGASYIGKTARSRTGKTCQNWSENSPVDLNKFQQYFMKKSQVNIREFPENHCRNPGGLFKAPVCIVPPSADHTNRYDYCVIPKCVEVEKRILESNDELDNRIEDLDSHDSVQRQRGEEEVIDNEPSDANTQNIKRNPDGSKKVKPTLPKENCGNLKPARDCWNGDTRFSCFRPAKNPNQYLPCRKSDSWVTPLECGDKSLVWNHKIFTCDYPKSQRD